MLYSLLTADPTYGLSVDNPFVLGPIAAFIFTVFVMEIIVPGKSYRREVEENVRLRTLVEKVVPLAEALVTTAADIIAVTKENTLALNHFLQFMSDEGGPGWKR